MLNVIHVNTQYTHKHTNSIIKIFVLRYHSCLNSKRIMKKIWVCVLPWKDGKMSNIYWDHIQTRQTYSMTMIEDSNLMPLCKGCFAMIICPLDGGGTFLLTQVKQITLLVCLQLPRKFKVFGVINDTYLYKAYIKRATSYTVAVVPTFQV